MALLGFLRSAVPRWTSLFALTEGFVVFSIPFAAPLLSVAMLFRLRVTILGADATPGQINRLLDGGARDYKPAQSVEVALDVIVEEREKQFDPQLVDVFLKLQPRRGLDRLNAAIDRDRAAMPDTASRWTD